jgi:phospholipid/cholesterol/gamma-HCH transport system substrate-binding protein
MSKPVSPIAIGSFLVGATVLLTAALLIFGGGELFKEKRQFVIFFDSSLDGLNAGAPVKIQGVQVGSVKEVALQMDPSKARLVKPVVIEFDPGRVIDPRGRPMEAARTEQEREENMRRLIEAGFRARLEMQSLLTGLLYVEFNFYPKAPVELTGLDYKGLPELPSIPTATDELRNALDEVLTEARALPLEDIVRDLSATLREIRDTVKSDDVLRARAALAKTLEGTEQLITKLSHHLDPVLVEARETTKATRALVRDLHSETRGGIRPVLAAAEQTLRKAEAVLDESRGALSAVGSFSGSDSPLHQTLLEVRNTARSLRDLTDYLERHPDSVLYGKP